MRSVPLYLSIAVFLAFIGKAVAAQAVKPLVTTKEAEHLVMAELIHEHRDKLPGLVLSSEPDPVKGMEAFWVISVDWDERKNGEQYGTGHFGYFAVDKMTGDLWDGTSCNGYESRELERAQKQLRRRLGLTARDYKRLRRDGPYC